MNRRIDGGISCFHFGNNCRRWKKLPTRYYKLDAIIAVGYRVNSFQATQFRIWATKTLREFIVKGFVLDDERLKQGKRVFGKDYFDELLERIREIRASERRFYQKITDIYALSVDYNAAAPLTKEFFATVQNKLHWAITGQTAAELIYTSADATKFAPSPTMATGPTPWRRASGCPSTMRGISSRARMIRQLARPVKRTGGETVSCRRAESLETLFTVPGRFA